jgi:hypothetical protein
MCSALVKLQYCQLQRSALTGMFLLLQVLLFYEALIRQKLDEQDNLGISEPDAYFGFIGGAYCLAYLQFVVFAALLPLVGRLTFACIIEMQESLHAGLQ